MTRTRKISTLLLTVAFLASATLVFVPAAQAQTQTQLTIDRVNAPVDPIAPELQNPKLTVEFTYTLDNPAATVPTAAKTNVQIDFTFSCNSPDVIITGPTSRLLQLQAGQSASFTDTADFNVAITRNAPGLELLPCTVSATAKPLNQQQGSATSAAVPFSVTADYYSLLQAKVNQQLKRSTPDKEVPFEIELSNLGNAATRVSFELTERPAGGRWSPIAPLSFVLQSPNTGKTPTQDTAIFQVSSTYKNGWNNEKGAFQMTITSEAADAPEKDGQTLTTNFVLRVRGVYVPTLEPLIMVGAVLSMAFVARMRRDEE